MRFLKKFHTLALTFQTFTNEQMDGNVRPWVFAHESALQYLPVRDMLHINVPCNFLKMQDLHLESSDYPMNNRCVWNHVLHSHTDRNNAVHDSLINTIFNDAAISESSETIVFNKQITATYASDSSEGKLVVYSSAVMSLGLIQWL